MSDADVTPATERRARVLLARVASASAGIIALCALAVSAYQAKLSREQQRMSVWPYLMQYNSGRGGGYYREVQNAGLGPAIIGWQEVLVDDRPQRNWGDVLRALTHTTDSSFNIVYSSLPPGSVLIPGAVQDVIELAPGSFAQSIHASIDSGRLVTRVCFCSLYEECWIATSGERKPVPIRACDVDSTRVFTN